MEFQLQSEDGKRLFSVLANWMKKSPELAGAELKRLFVTGLFKVKSEDGFLTALCDQKILDQAASVLSQRFPSTLLRVQHAVEMCLNKGCVKELVVALEMSENQGLLAEVLNWTEKNLDQFQESFTSASAVDLAPVKVLKSKNIQQSDESVPSVDLAPVKVQKRKEIQETAESLPEVDLAPVKVQKRKLLSEITSGPVTPRHREINWVGEEKYCTVLEVLKNKIIVGWNSGQIKIYNSDNLSCETVLNYGGGEVTCLQSTGTEIIAGYEDGKISVWNIQGAFFMLNLSVGNGSCGKDFPTSMRWNDPKLVVATAHGRIHVWHRISSFTLESSWDTGDCHVRELDFNENYVILGPSCRSETVKVHDFNGRKIRSISSCVGILQMAVHRNHLITCNRQGQVQIWDLSTGRCLKELKELGMYMFGFDAHQGVIASGNRCESVTVWKIDTAVAGSHAELVSLPHRQIKCVPFDALVDEIKLGSNFVVAKTKDCEQQRKIFVTDFLS